MFKTFPFKLQAFVICVLRLANFRLNSYTTELYRTCWSLFRIGKEQLHCSKHGHTHLKEPERLILGVQVPHVRTARFI